MNWRIRFPDSVLVARADEKARVGRRALRFVWLPYAPDDTRARAEK